MKQILNLTLLRSIPPTLFGLAIIVLVTLPLSNRLNAQETEPQPYDPCAPAQVLGPTCLDGSRTCNEIQPNCSEGYCWAGGGIPNNAGIPVNGVVENKVIEIGGTYTVTISVRFVNCTFKMLGDSRVNISPAGSGVMKVFFENCDFYSCSGMWQGISVDASSALNGLLFSIWDSNIEDAHIGLNLDEGLGNGPAVNNAYQITNNTFRNNHIGISNRRQMGGFLNAVIRRNQFFQTANLAAKVGSLVNINMPGYPLAYTGIKYVSLTSTVGVNQPSEANLFTCLLNGLITEGPRSVIASINNTFDKTANNGIWTTDGRIDVINCRFQVSGQYGVNTDGAVLMASANQFSGNWDIGIRSLNNLNGELIRIDLNNVFTINSGDWEAGVYVERPQNTVSSIPHCVIDHNVFNVAGAVTEFACISLIDLVDASDEAQITWNTITVNSTFNFIYGIRAALGNSDNCKIEDNTITFGTVGNSFGSFGILLGPVDPAGQNASQGHIVRHNTILGPNVTPDGVNCGIHSVTVQGIEYCDNDVDYTYNGLHFVNDCGDVALRQNHFHHHTNGLNISGYFAADMPGVGPQFGRGNTWNIAHGDCIDWAVLHDVPATPTPYMITSPFRIPEFTNPPFRYYPLPTKISPNPTLPGPNSNWFRELAVDTDYCIPGPALETPRKQTAYEKQLVDGLSSYTGTTLWDLQLRTYTKLLLRPELRPSGSPEEAFFNGFLNSPIAAFGQVVQLMGSGLAMSAADQQSFDSYRTAAQQAVLDLTNWDANQDYSSSNNLDETWFANRVALLQLLAVNIASEALLESTRTTQVSTGLQNALTYNTEIPATQPYDVARKALNDIWLHRLLKEPMTQAYYQQILALAQQDPASAGNAARSAVSFLAPCDQGQFPPEEELGGEERDAVSDQTIKRGGTNMFKVSPNPSTGWVELSVFPKGATLFVVMNAYGQKVYRAEVTADTRSASLDLSHLVPGLYWGILLDDKGQSLGIQAISLIR